MTSTPPRRWIAWATLAVFSLLALGSVTASAILQKHADERREVMVELGAIETLATAHSGIVWRALTTQLVDDKMKFIRIRGEEQMGRGEIFDRLAALRELEGRGSELTEWLGFDLTTEELDNLDDSAHSFLGGVQATFGQMSLSPDRIRQRLQYWDMNFGQFEECLAALRERDGAIAEASSKAAMRVTGFAALKTLIATALLVLRLSQLRIRRASDLQQERLTAIAASEARFRELVQNTSDMIIVAKGDGSVRYASPSARILTESLRSDESTEENAADSVAAAEAIEQAIASGALDQAEDAADKATRAIERAMGATVQELLLAERSEITVVGAEGLEHTFDVQARDLTDQPNIGGVVLNARDVTERKTLEEKLRHQALHDPLTNLPNRRAFQLRFDAMTTEERANASVLFVDLDGFKLVNDSYGHKVGDDLLRTVSYRIGSCVRTGDVLARQGGDEFLILYAGDAAALAESIQNVLKPPFTLEGREIFVTASIGVVTNIKELDAEQAAQRADIAMYEAKAAGKAQAIIFADEMLAGAPERLALESDFRHALERDEFTVVYQPKVGLKSGRTESLEALVRWIHPTRGFVGPDLFIPFAEESGLIAELGKIVLEKSCMDAIRWKGMGVVVAVNLSPVQFRNPRLVDEVREAIEKSGIDPKFLELEITESAVLGDVANTIEVLNKLKALGCRLAIDDFGTGYSNLAHLKHFNVDVLKIDQAFVRGGNPSSMEHLSDGAIVQAVIGMAKAFDMHVVAEGVETISHVNELRDLGADLGQGYYFSKPVPSDEIDRILEAESKAPAA